MHLLFDLPLSSLPQIDLPLIYAQQLLAKVMEQVLMQEGWITQRQLGTSALGILKRIERRVRKKRPRDDSPPTKQAFINLISVADRVGSLLQYDHQGFTANTRKFRAAGLAAIELSQMLRKALHPSKPTTLKRIASNCPGHCIQNFTNLKERCQNFAAKSASWMPMKWRVGLCPVQEDKCSSCNSQQPGKAHGVFGWRDAIDVLVRWRFITEPADPILWVDGLPQQNLEEGFGSYTPLLMRNMPSIRCGAVQVDSRK